MIELVDETRHGFYQEKGVLLLLLPVLLLLLLLSPSFLSLELLGFLKKNWVRRARPICRTNKEGSYNKSTMVRTWVEVMQCRPTSAAAAAAAAIVAAAAGGGGGGGGTSAFEIQEEEEEEEEAAQAEDREGEVVGAAAFA